MAGYLGTKAVFLSTTAASVTGNITVGGTVDGRDVATDGSKLDGIEAGADVTDTTNVTAAGALMDSEVTNLAAVKAFDPTDYATAAQGTLADSAVQPNDSPTFGTVTATSFSGDGSALTGINTNPYDSDTSSTGYFDLPSGTNAQRPASPDTGNIRYNTSLGKYEVYYSTGWESLTSEPPMSGSGGTTVTSGGYKYHTFTSSGTFTANVSGTVEYLIVAGGGAGGRYHSGGGGGAGGYITGSVSISSGAKSIVIGAGGTGASTWTSGNNTTALGFTVIGGGKGGSESLGVNGFSGGSGGGGSGGYGPTSGGAGTSGQGNSGGTGNTGGGGDYGTGGGGGGKGGAGSNGVNGQGNGANGGIGSNAQSAWATATSTGDGGYYAGGGGGGSWNSPNLGGAGGAGGGGDGADAGVNQGDHGLANTGGGGGGSAADSSNRDGGNGGSGIVIIRYPV